MKIQLLDQYKSLQPFESEDLNELTIITGKNGSGKTQLLELIGKKAIGDQSVVTIRLQFSPSIKQIQVEGIEAKYASEINYTQWKTVLDRQVAAFARLGNASKELLSFIFSQDEDFLLQDWNIPQELFSEDEKYKELLSKSYAEILKTNLLAAKNVNAYHQEDVFREINQHDGAAMLRTLKELISRTGKKMIQILAHEFYTVGLSENLIDSDNLFSSQIELIFYNYSKRRDTNRRNYFDKREDGVVNDTIPDKEFIAKFLPPWDIINQELYKHNIGFYFEEIKKDKFDPQVNQPLLLVKKSNAKPIGFDGLSSGEKIIIGLIIKMFTSEYYKKTLRFPELLILDEPDAHLHPEMSKLLIDVLGETFVKKFGIKVIFTTHSPSTIALAPEAAIYELKNDNPTSLKKVTKDYALNLLTSFLPTLSIDYKNHRQIFVESPTDIDYYQALFDKHSQHKPLSHKLYFISNAMGKGNCDQVYSIVKALRDSGNKTSYGIVDWDLKNNSESNVFVHGKNERYSVENFILDPIYLVTILIQLGNAHNVCQMTGLKESDNEYLIGLKSDVELLAIGNIIFNLMQTKFPALKANEDRMEIKYLNGRTLKVPLWFLTEQGHSLEEKFKEVFPALKNKFMKEGDLQKELISIMTKSYPFVPLTSIALIEKLAN